MIGPAYIFITHIRYQCTVKGGREGLDLEVLQMVRACEELGAGELLLNCINTDGQRSGFDLVLVKYFMPPFTCFVLLNSWNLSSSLPHFVFSYNTELSVRLLIFP